MSDDKRELLRLKQGLVSKDESKLDLEKTVITKPTGISAVKNFFYHYKFEALIALFFVVVIIIFVYFTATKEKSDITMLLLSNSDEASGFFYLEQGELKKAIEHFVDDYDENGEQSAECLFIDLTTKVGDANRNPEAIQGNQIKLFGEIQGRNSVFFIGNKGVLKQIPVSANVSAKEFYVDLSDIVDGNLLSGDIFFPLKGSKIEMNGDFNIREIPDDLYIGIRNIEGDELYKSLEVLKNIVG